MKKKEEIKRDLDFFTGSEHAFCLFKGMRWNYTDGARYVFINCKAHSLLYTLLHVLERPELKREDFLTVELNRLNENSFNLFFTDGNRNTLFSMTYINGKFPLDELKLFFENSMLYLPSER